MQPATDSAQEKTHFAFVFMARKPFDYSHGEGSKHETDTIAALLINHLDATLSFHAPNWGLIEPSIGDDDRAAVPLSLLKGLLEFSKPLSDAVLQFPLVVNFLLAILVQELSTPGIGLLFVLTLFRRSSLNEGPWIMLVDLISNLPKTSIRRVILNIMPMYELFLQKARPDDESFGTWIDRFSQLLQIFADISRYS